MKFLQWSKDGGEESNVDGFFLVEIKGLFSIVLLKFNKGLREKYHSHAFNAMTWFIKGDMQEQFQDQAPPKKYKRSWKPKITKIGDFHRVKAFQDSWAISIRGPWINTWHEYDEKENKYTTLSKGRVQISEWRK